MYKRFVVLVLFVLAVAGTSAHADTLTGLADVTVVNGEIISLRYEGTEYVIADGLLALGTTTRWYIDGGVEVLWPDGDPVPAAAPTVAGTSDAKVGDVGSKADNFLFTLNGSTDIGLMQDENRPTGWLTCCCLSLWVKVILLQRAIQVNHARHNGHVH